MQGTGTHSFSSNDAHALTHHRPCVSFLGLPQCSVTNWMTSNMLSSPSHGSRSRGLGSGCPGPRFPRHSRGGALLPLTVSGAPGAPWLGLRPPSLSLHLHITISLLPASLCFQIPFSMSPNLCLNPPPLTRTAFICAGWRPMLMTSP